MKKKITALLLTTVMVLSLTACGETARSTENTTDTNVEGEITVSESNSYEPSETESPESAKPPIAVYIYDKSTADINIYNVDGSSTAQGREWSVCFGEYKVSLQDFGQDEPQCSVWKMNGDNAEFVAMAQGTFEGNMLRFNISMSEVPDFSFDDVTSYTLYVNEDGRGGPTTEFAAADVVQQNSIGEGNGTDSDDTTSPDNTNVSDTVPVDYTNITFVCADNQLIITELDGQGYPLSMTMNGKAISFSEVVVRDPVVDGLHADLCWNEPSAPGGTMAVEFYYFYNENKIVLKGYATGEYYTAASGNGDIIDLSAYISKNDGFFIPYYDNSDSFTLTDNGNGVYQFINIWIDSPIYYVDGERIPGETGNCNEMSTSFTASDCIKDGDTFVLEFTTNYGCTGKAIFYDNKDIQLNLLLGDKSYTMKFC